MQIRSQWVLTKNQGNTMEMKMLQDEAYTIFGCGIFSHNTNSYIKPDSRGRYQLFGKAFSINFWVKLFGLGDILKHRYTILSNGTIFGLNGKKMKPQPDTKGYQRVIMQGKTVKIHRVIAEAFVPNPDNKPHVNHINSDKTDNRADNLKWVTNQENSDHRWGRGDYAI